MSDDSDKGVTDEDAWGVHPRPLPGAETRTAPSALQLVITGLDKDEEIISMNAGVPGVFIATNKRVFSLQKTSNGPVFVPMQFATYQPVPAVEGEKT